MSLSPDFKVKSWGLQLHTQLEKFVQPLLAQSQVMLLS